MPPVHTDATLTSARRRNDLPLPVRAWVRIMRVFHRIDRRSTGNLRAWDLSVARFDLLNHAGLHAGITQQDLADALLVTRGNICQLLDALERDGLIRREKQGRANLVYLTLRGHELRNVAMESHVEIITAAMHTLSNDELRTLTDLLRKIERGLDASDASPSDATPPLETRTS